MELYINGYQLDLMKGQDVELNWTNIRFDGPLADEWSTDVQLANSPNNIKRLDAYGLLDRGPIFNRQVPCSVLINEISYDGYLHVTEFTKDTITATVYLLTIPYSLYDKELREYYPADDNTTIFRWDRMTTIKQNNNNSDVAIYRYNYNTEYYSNIVAQLHPSIRVSKIVEAIETAENITLPTIDNSLFFTAPKQVVCPQNKYQCFMWRWKDNTPPSGAISLIGGQHITNDFKCSWSYSDFVWNQSYTDWNLPSTYQHLTDEATTNTITFNRSCTCRIWVYGTTSRATWNVHIYKNNTDLTSGYIGGTNLYRLPNGSGDTPPTWDTQDALACYLPLTSFNKDDTLHFEIGVTSGAALNTVGNISVLIEYLSYDITDDDYDTELNYYPMQFGLAYAWLNGAGTTTTEGFRQQSGTGFGVNGFLDHSFCYYGAYANMGSCSVRDFLTEMCWMHNYKLKLDKFTLEFSNAYTTKQIKGNITTISTFADELGQLNKIGYKDLALPILWRVDNDFLDEEKTIHESIFTTSMYRYGIATIEQYEFNNKMHTPTTQDEAWVEDIDVKMNDFDFIIFSLQISGHYYRLERAKELTDFGLTDINSTVCATIETYDNCKDIDYVYLDGRKYLVISGSVDMGSGLNTLETIEIPTTYTSVCAPPTITTSYMPTSSDCTVYYNLYDNTGQGTYTMTVKQGSTVIDTYQLQIGTAQMIQIYGLSANTTYTVEITGSNSCGTLSETETFATLSVVSSVTLDDCSLDPQSPTDSVYVEVTGTVWSGGYVDNVGVKFFAQNSTTSTMLGNVYGQQGQDFLITTARNLPAGTTMYAFAYMDYLVDNQMFTVYSASQQITTQPNVVINTMNVTNTSCRGTITIIGTATSESVKYKTVSAGTWSDAVMSGRNSFLINGLTPNTTYQIKATATNAGGTYNSAVSTFTTSQEEARITLEDTSTLKDGVLDWSANFTSTYPMASGTVTACKDDKDYEVLENATVIFEGTTSGIAKSDMSMKIGVETCVILFKGVDDEGNKLEDEYWI